MRCLEKKNSEECVRVRVYARVRVCVCMVNAHRMYGLECRFGRKFDIDLMQSKWLINVKKCVTKFRSTSLEIC